MDWRAKEQCLINGSNGWLICVALRLALGPSQGLFSGYKVLFSVG